MLSTDLEVSIHSFFLTRNWIGAGHEVEGDRICGSRWMGGAWRSFWVQFVEAICWGSHVVLHTIQESIIVSSCCCHTRGGRGHHKLASPLTITTMVTISVILGAIIPLCCWLSGIAGQCCWVMELKNRLENHCNDEWSCLSSVSINVRKHVYS